MTVRNKDTQRKLLSITIGGLSGLILSGCVSYPISKGWLATIGFAVLGGLLGAFVGYCIDKKIEPDYACIFGSSV